MLAQAKQVEAKRYPTTMLGSLKENRHLCHYKKAEPDIPQPNVDSATKVLKWLQATTAADCTPEINIHANTVVHDIQIDSAQLFVKMLESEPFEDSMEKHKMTKPSQSIRRKGVHKVEKDMENKKHIDTVNIKSFKFITFRSVIVKKLDTNSTKNSSKIVYRIDVGSYGNLVPHNGIPLF